MQNRKRICLHIATSGRRYRDGHRICEIAALQIDENHRIVGRFHSFIDPGCMMDPEHAAANGYDGSFLVGKPSFSVIAPKFLEFAKGAELLVHDASYVCSFLNRELGACGQEFLENTGCIANECFAGVAYAEIAAKAGVRLEDNADAMERCEADTRVLAWLENPPPVKEQPKDEPEAKAEDGKEEGDGKSAEEDGETKEKKRPKYDSNGLVISALDSPFEEPVFSTEIKKVVETENSTIEKEEKTEIYINLAKPVMFIYLLFLKLVSFSLAVLTFVLKALSVIMLIPIITDIFKKLTGGK